MTGELVPFNFESHEVRVSVDLYGEPWWIASDVCKVLGIVNPRQALTRVDREDVGSTDTLTAGGRQTVNTVSESGLYELIFASKKPEARAFRRWVTKEVLPQIRKTGQYIPNEANDKRGYQLHLIGMAKGLLPDSHLAEYTKMVLGQALQIEMAPAEFRLLTVDEYLEEKGWPASARRSARTIFGKALAKAYRSHYGEEPKKVDRIIDGTLRGVNGYTEEHRHLFDIVFERLT